MRRHAAPAPMLQKRKQGEQSHIKLPAYNANRKWTQEANQLPVLDLKKKKKPDCLNFTSNPSLSRAPMQLTSLQKTRIQSQGPEEHRVRPPDPSHTHTELEGSAWAPWCQRALRALLKGHPLFIYFLKTDTPPSQPHRPTGRSTDVRSQGTQPTQANNKSTSNKTLMKRGLLHV